MKKINKWTIAILFLSMTLNYSCKKEEDDSAGTTDNTDSNDATDNNTPNPKAYDISFASYVEENYGVENEETLSRDVTFNEDGTKMFVIGSSGDAIVEYHLSTAFDVSTATYAEASEELYVGRIENISEGLTFNTDGTKMFVIGLGSNTVLEYHLSTAFDVSTATIKIGEFPVISHENNPHDLTFNTDGTKMFVIGATDDAVIEYHLSTGYDLSTASHAGASEEFSVSGQETAPRGLTFNTDGTKMFVVGSDNAAVVEYHLSTGFDVSTASYAKEFSVNGQETLPSGLTFNTEGTKMFVIGSTDKAVVEYTLTTAFDVSTASHPGENEEFYTGGQDNSPTGLTFNADGTKMFVMGAQGRDIIEYDLSTGFDVSTATYAGLINQFSVHNEEPVPLGLTFNADGTELFVIGYDSKAVIKYVIE